MNSERFNSSFNSSTSTSNGLLQWLQCSPAFYVYIVSEMFNTLLGLFTNIWVQVLILRDWRNQAVQEIFTLNLGVLEILYCFLSQVLILNYIAVKMFYTYKYNWLVYGLSFFGRSLFQCGICVERYIAVVHPMFFFRHHFLRYKIIFLIVGWLITAVLIWFVIYYPALSLTVCLFIIVMSVNMFCSLSIIRVLRQPSPGAEKKVKEMNLKKKRACYTVMIIQATVVFNYVAIFIGPTIKLNTSYFFYMCVYQPLGLSCCLMGSFLQPLIFLHRAGKLQWPGHKEFFKRVK